MYKDKEILKRKMFCVFSFKQIPHRAQFQCDSLSGERRLRLWEHLPPPSSSSGWITGLHFALWLFFFLSSIHLLSFPPGHQTLGLLPGPPGSPLLPSTPRPLGPELPINPCSRHRSRWVSMSLIWWAHGFLCKLQSRIREVEQNGARGERGRGGRGDRMNHCSTASSWSAHQ